MMIPKQLTQAITLWTDLSNISAPFFDCQIKFGMSLADCGFSNP